MYLQKTQCWRGTKVLTNPELVCHVAKTCDILSPALHEVLPADGAALQHLQAQSTAALPSVSNNLHRFVNGKWGGFF